MTIPFSLLRLVSVVVALALVAGCTIGLYPLRDYLPGPVVALLYLLPVILSATNGGIWAGAVAALAAFLAFNYFFIKPYNSLFVHQTQDLLALVVFLGVAIFTSQVMGRVKASLAAAAAGERQATWLHELSNTLTRLHESEAIAQELALQCQRVFQTDGVEVSLEISPGAPLQVVRYPGGYNTPTQRPELIVPLESARGLLGEIALWREMPFSPVEERLLNTFANQGVLILERARLLQSETRARVLEESDQLKTALLNSVSHELRTPLATIKASVSSLRSDAVEWDSEARKELLAVIEEETDALNLLVGNLLDMSRIEAGALRLQRSWNVLAEIAGGVIGRLKRGSPGCKIEAEFPADLPLIPVDYGLMEQVFANLISNSLKFAPPGRPIRVEARRQDAATVLVRVSNHGPSIPESDLERIFDKFYRASANERITGTGLGLSICKGIVEAHGGRIWAENLYHADGIAFIFVLPLQVDDMPPLKAVEADLL